MLRTMAVATALAGTLLCVGEAAAQNADVMHWWTSGGESRAVAVFAKEYNKRGGTWVMMPPSDRRRSMPRLSTASPAAILRQRCNGISASPCDAGEQGSCATG